ncbi:MAG TPA: anti-sigma factor [Euzebya sp.]|nr:anti-sigma factor [Euzebya sp.]
MSEDLYTLAGAYVLDALDDDERAAFEAFMASSPEVRAEVESLREAATLLGSAAAQTPPESLKGAVMAQIDTVRQQPPVLTSLGEARSARDAEAPLPPRWITTLTRGAAAVAVVIAVGLGVAVVQLSARLDQLESASQQVASLVAAADAQPVSVALAAGGRISAVISPEQGSALVVGDGLPVLGEGRMYALWSITDGIPSPVGELVEGRAVTVDVDDLRTLGVTIEPRGPLTTPTSDPVGVLTV